MPNYPGSLDTLTNPTSGDNLDSPSHSAQHATANDILEALEAKVGIGADVAATGELLVGTGAGASAWQSPATIGLQPLDADLTALAALTPTNDDFVQRKSGVWVNRSVAQVLTDLGIAAAYQPLDSDLTAFAALAPTNDDVVQRKAGAWANRTIAQLLTDLAVPGTTFQPLDADLTAIAALATTAYGRSLLAVANDASLKAYLALTPGTDIQAYDADLAAIAGIAAVANNIIQFKSGSWTGRSMNQLIADLATATATFQPVDAELTAIAGLASAASKVPRFTGSGTADLVDFISATSWTPVLTTGTPGTLAVAYTTQAGSYQRFGDIIFWRLNILTSTWTLGTATGNIIVSGLPVAAGSASQPGMSCAFAGYTKANYTSITPEVVASGTTMQFRASGSGQALAFLAVGDVPTGGPVTIRAEGFYFV